MSKITNSNQSQKSYRKYISENGRTRTSEYIRGGIRCHGGVSLQCWQVTPAVNRNVLLQIFNVVGYVFIQIVRPYMARWISWQITQHPWQMIIKQGWRWVSPVGRGRLLEFVFPTGRTSSMAFRYLCYFNLGTWPNLCCFQGSLQTCILILIVPLSDPSTVLFVDPVYRNWSPDFDCRLLRLPDHDTHWFLCF
jgi:hypothetical protein